MSDDNESEAPVPYGPPCGLCGSLTWTWRETHKGGAPLGCNECTSEPVHTDEGGEDA